jgi:lipid-A-disaccharide synthase
MFHLATLIKFKQMKYYVIAGEASGDLHASNLIKAIKNNDNNAVFRAWGGNLMEQQGAEIVKHIDELAFMGFSEVIKNLGIIIRNINFCKKDILAYKPDAVIFVDYPGFNLRIAKYCKAKKIPTIYYISPTVWAWHKSRIKQIKKNIDKLLVILPFEKDFFNKHNYHVEFVGHPLLDALENERININQTEFRKKHNLDDKKIIALLPGSRKQEIAKMLPVMAKTSELFPQYQFVIAGTTSHKKEFYQQFSEETSFPIVFGETYPLIKNSFAALVTSGTATLETALIGTPQVVCYKTGTISYQIAKRLVDVKYISLVNLILNKEVVTELIQDDFNLHTLSQKLQEITEDQEIRKTILENYALLRKKLGDGGASVKSAGIILKFLSEKTD